MAPRLAGVVIALAAAVVSASCTSVPSDPAPPSVPQPSTTVGGLALLQPRAVHRATTLLDGRVLITGGCTAAFCEDFESGRRSELFDPASGRLAAGPEALEPRASGTAALLPDGRVLLTGGYPGEGRDPSASMEVFEPGAECFSSLGNMSSARAVHTATALSDGRVLLVGGYDADGNVLSSTEFFDPATGAVTRGPDLSHPRAGHAAVVAGERLVLVGGSDGEAAISTTEVLENGVWRPGPDLTAARVKHGAAALPDGRVLVVGGSSSDEGNDLLRSTEIVDVASGAVVAGPDLSEGQYKLDGAVTSLGDGRVVIAGGTRLNVYDPATGEISVVDGDPIPRRSFATATAVDADAVLVTGGYDTRIIPSNAARIVTVLL